MYMEQYGEERVESVQFIWERSDEIHLIFFRGRKCVWKRCKVSVCREEERECLFIHLLLSTVFTLVYLVQLLTIPLQLINTLFFLPLCSNREVGDRNEIEKRGLPHKKGPSKVLKSSIFFMHGLLLRTWYFQGVKAVSTWLPKGLRCSSLNHLYDAVRWSLCRGANTKGGV